VVVVVLKAVGGCFHRSLLAAMSVMASLRNYTPPGYSKGPLPLTGGFLIVSAGVEAGEAQAFLRWHARSRRRASAAMTTRTSPGAALACPGCLSGEVEWALEVKEWEAQVECTCRKCGHRRAVGLSSDQALRLHLHRARPIVPA